MINGNEIADQLARQGSSHPLTGPGPALGIYAKVARGVIRGWTSRKHKEYGHSIHGKRQAKGSLERPYAKIVGELFNLNKNQLIMLSQLLKDTTI